MQRAREFLVWCWKACDLKASIPMKGQTGSLNAAVATAVLMYEKVRQDDCKELNSFVAVIRSGGKKPLPSIGILILVLLCICHHVDCGL